MLYDMTGSSFLSVSFDLVHGGFGRANIIINLFDDF